MTIDVIILSYAKNDTIVKMNNDCINSMLNSTDNYEFNIFLVETEPNKIFTYEQKEVTVIQPKIKFGYNKFLNIGLDYCKNEWILLSNNDTIYEKLFIDYMILAHEIDNEILSMSPIDDSWARQNKYDRDMLMHYGHRLQCELAAWSILINRKVIDIIGKFDENFTFWYQDCDFANNLITHNIKHVLITKSKVHHLLSKSNHLVENWDNMVNTCSKYFYSKWKTKLDELE
jgi:GT2 family glycosyltransferase